MEDIEHQETGLLQGKAVRISRKFSLVEKLKHLPVIEGWTTYMHQEAMLAGLALALLYFTVLRCSLFLSTNLVVYIFCAMQNGYLDAPKSYVKMEKYLYAVIRIILCGGILHICD